LKTNARLIERLEKGQIDCAALPYNINGFESVIFWQECFYVALPAKHPLTKKRAISLTQLPMEEVKLLEESHCMRDHALGACHTKSCQHKTSVQGTRLYCMILDSAVDR